MNTLTAQNFDSRSRSRNTAHYVKGSKEGLKHINWHMVSSFRSMVADLRYTQRGQTRSTLEDYSGTTCGHSL